MQGIMIFVLIKYYQTKNDSGAGRNTPWAESPKVWPTYMLAAASGVTLVVTIFALVALCCSKASGGNTKIWTVVLKYAFHIISWLIVSVIYRVSKTGDDLWGWSCSAKAAAIQDAFKSELNFSSLCNLQVRLCTTLSSPILTRTYATRAVAKRILIL
jgi:hypothetical protein